MTRELEGIEESLKVEIHIDLFKTTLWFLVQEIHLHSRQTSTKKEQIPTRSTRTRMDDQRKITLIQKDQAKEPPQTTTDP